MTTSRRGAVALLAWAGFLVATLAALHSLGANLAPPPTTGIAQLREWVAERQPAEMAFAVVRLTALALAWYLLVATVVSFVARVARLHALATVVDSLTVPFVRRLVHGAASLSIASASVGGAFGATAATADAPPPVVTMRRLPDATGAAPPVASAEVMRRLPEEPAETAALPEEPAETAAAPAAWTVRPGDHFWAVAEQVLSAAWRRAPNDNEIAPYWRSLVAANRDRLLDRTNPDLVFPGQVLVVPPPPPGPR